MEERLVDILLETFERKRKYFENYKYYCNKIKEIGKKNSERCKSSGIWVNC